MQFYGYVSLSFHLFCFIYMYLSEMYVPTEQCREGEIVSTVIYIELDYIILPTVDLKHHLMASFQNWYLLQCHFLRLHRCSSYVHCIVPPDYDCNVCFCLVQLFTGTSGSMFIKGQKKWVTRLLRHWYIWKIHYLN